jgi:hypothetical protein
MRLKPITTAISLYTGGKVEYDPNEDIFYSKVKYVG